MPDLAADTRLSEATEQALIGFAHAFDGYAYQAHTWPGAENELAQLLATFLRTGELPAAPESALALNFYLHRCFRHWGALPAAYSPHWWAMVHLYQTLYRCPLPARWQHAGSAQVWAEAAPGTAEAAAAALRQRTPDLREER